MVLSNGTTIKVGELSSENKLFTFLNNANTTIDADKSKGWITLDRTYFKSGAAELLPSSQEQVANIAAILKAFPKAKIKMGGYTDSTGSLDTNKKVST